MYAKSFIALNGNGRLTGARTAQTAPYDRYNCHLCGSALQYHPKYETNRPWYEHIEHGLTDNGFRHCPYVNTGPLEVKLIQQLRTVLPDACRVVLQMDWRCSKCDSDYHGERYCLTCRTGKFTIVTTPASSIGEVT